MCINVFRKHAMIVIVLLAVLMSSCNENDEYIPPTPGNYPAELTKSLPPPRQVSISPLDKAAETLAREVLAGGDVRLPALVSAIQISGIAVRGADDGLAVQPATPWQGMIYEAWELVMIVNLLNQENHVTIGLTDLTEILSKSIPELQGVPLAQLFLEDIRTYAKEEDSPKRFWALFITELGRQATFHEPYDLLGEMDPAKVQLDGVQTSLILRQLATDLLIYAGRESSGSRDNQNPPGLIEPLVQPAYAESNLPCTLESKDRTILDLGAFGTKVGLTGIGVGDIRWKGVISYLEKERTSGALSGVDRFKLGTGIASIVATYVKLIYTYAALEVETSMESPPLIRTKMMRPPGETKRVVATVKLNIGSAQMVNCFRLMLNSAGVDFALPNHGPVRNASVSWVGLNGFNAGAAAPRGGPEQIVAFAGQINNLRTDNQGKVRATINGVGQKRELSEQARQVDKTASLHVAVAIEGSDLFKDVTKAIKAATGGPKLLFTLPADLLYRMQWAAGGHYEFKVIDWTEGCQGTIKYKYEESYNGDPENGVNYTGTYTVNQVWKLGQMIENNRYEATWTAHIEGSLTGTAEEYLETENVKGDLQLDPEITIELPQSETPPYVVRIKQTLFSRTSSQPNPIKSTYKAWCAGDPCAEETEDLWFLPKNLQMEFEYPEPKVTILRFTVGPEKGTRHFSDVGSLGGFPDEFVTPNRTWDIDITCK